MERRWYAVAAVVVVIVAAVALALLPDGDVTDPPAEVEPGRFGTIVYHADGADASGWPDTYVVGTYCRLPVPERDGMLFTGWFLDEDLTEPVGAIVPGTEGEVELYASWSDGIVGTGYTLSVSGTYYNGSLEHRMDGTTDYRFMTCVDGMVYVQFENSIVYTMPSGDTTTDERAGGYWSDGAWEGRFVGSGEYGGRICQIWDDGDSLNWIWDRYYVIHSETKEGPDDVSSDASEPYPFTPDLRFDMEVSSELPLTVSGSVGNTIGSPAVLRADGPGFSGWYSGGKLVSTDRVLRIGVADPSMSFEARCTEDFAVLPGGNVDLPSLGFEGQVTIRPFSGSEEPAEGGTVTLAPGYYEIRDSASPVSHVMYVFIDDTRVFELSWIFDREMHHVSVGMNLSDVFTYSLNDPMGNLRFIFGTQQQVDRYFTPDDVLVREIADQLEAQGAGMDRSEFAAFVLSFVQNIPYKDDMATTGQREYWKYPAETLWDGGGDCEDSAILYAVLMEALGYRSSIMVFQGHAMAGVVLDDVRGQSITIDGWRYVFCETTATGFEPGETADDREYNASKVLYAYATS